MDFLLPPPPSRLMRCIDGDRGKFINPPLDGSLTVSELYDFHYQNNPDYPVFVFSQPTSREPIHLTFRQVVPAAYKAAQLVANVIGLDIQDANHPRPTIGILSGSDTITYFTTVLGMLRAEITLFVISPRNSAAAVTHLLTKTHASHLLVSSEVSIQELARKATFNLNNTPHICAMPTYEDIFQSSPDILPLPSRRKDYTTTRVIVHTSGSTSFPKPVTWNDRSQLQVALVPLYGTHDFCGKIFGCHALAMFHGIGLNFIPWVAATGLIMATFPPASPAVIPTPDAVWNGLLATLPAYIFAPPVFLEGWSRDPAKLPFLKQLKGLIFGGAPLLQDVGDYLTAQGVPIYTLYGSSEAGPYCTIFPDHPGSDWEYFTVNPQCALEFLPLGDGTYELLVVDKGTTELTTLNATFKGRPAFATSDILAPHPTQSNKWKVLGRLDDQIMLSTGEKTNPGPLESILCQHPQVSYALMFGRGKFQNGVLVELKKEYYFDPGDFNMLTKFRMSMTPQIDALNSVAPTHSRLFKEMIIVAHSSKPFILNSKGFPMRSNVLLAYAAEIEALYADVAQIPNFKSSLHSFESQLDFVRSVVNDILKTPAQDDEDILDKGCDSLQATWMRQRIASALLSTGRKLDVPSNLVYEYPTVLSLAGYTTKALGNHHNQEADGLSVKTRDLTTFLEPYIAHFPAHRSTAIKTGSKPSGGVIFITGTTGALGAAVLAKLIPSDLVERIFAFHRETHGVPILQRQEEALGSRGYDPNLARSSKVNFVEGDLSKDGLGIESTFVEELRASVTHIFHIAWPVDFNRSLFSFKKTVDGVRGLVDLALSSTKPQPPKFLFTSSVGIFRNDIPEEPILEVPIENPRVPVGSGYAESKWVAEQILFEAAKVTPLRPTVVRVGQICGGVNGAWNTSDWVPAVVKSSLRIGFLPSFRGGCSWIPLDFAAEIFRDIGFTEVPLATAHLVHPAPVSCHEVFSEIGRMLRLPLRPYSDWVDALNTLSNNPSIGNTDLSSLPAAKLLSFFVDALSKDSETRDVMGVPKLDTRQTSQVSLVFREEGKANSLGPDQITRWLEYWRSVELLPDRV